MRVVCLHAVSLAVPCLVCVRNAPAAGKCVSLCMVADVTNAHILDAHPPTPSSSPAPPSPPPAPLFARAAGSHAPLSPLERAAIIVLAKDGQPRSAIAEKVGVSTPTVRHWIEAGDVKDAPRSGRPRVTDELLDTAIAGASMLDPFLPSSQAAAGPTGPR